MKQPNYPNLEDKEDFCNKISDHFNSDIVTVKQINEFIKENNLPYPHFLTITREHSVGWGKYKVKGNNFSGAKNKTTATPKKGLVKPRVPVETTMPAVLSVQNNPEALVPSTDGTYVPFGFYSDLKNIIHSKIFYPIYITGLSGNGKTFMVIQVCAALKRELIRVNITKDTDELDLFGTYELIDGNTIRKDGPVLTAMKRGAVLLLDETDYGSERLLCLQPVLEGKPYLDKKTNTVVYPQPGFNVIACANTKGKGSSDGRFIGANVLNEAFLERFAITVEQEYPNIATETKILMKNFNELQVNDSHFVKCLVTWAEQVRKTYNDGAIDEVISTRRLVHISKAYAIFKNKMKSINLCLNRFDTDTKTALVDLYTKIDALKDKNTMQPFGEEEPAKQDENKENVIQANASEEVPTETNIQNDIAWMPVCADLVRDLGDNVSSVQMTVDPTTKKYLIQITDKSGVMIPITFPVNADWDAMINYPAFRDQVQSLYNMMTNPVPF